MPLYDCIPAESAAVSPGKIIVPRIVVGGVILSWLPPHLSMVLSILPHCLMFTSGRPRLAALHVATLVYGVIIEIFGFWCPLTAPEEWLQVRGGVSAYRGPFLLHYLDAVVYPNIPPNLLIAGAVAVCVLNLWIYARRLHVQHSLG